MCGTAPYEWDPAQGGTRHAYEVVEHFCWGCYEREYMQDGVKQSPGVRLELARTGTVEAAQRAVRAEKRAARDAMKGRRRDSAR